jgi:phosphoglycolate phosphatase-like HAD superfamily hydrolase
VARIFLFDIDLTLIHTNGAGGAAIRDVFRDRFGVADALERMRVDGMVDHDIFTRILGPHGPDEAGMLYAAVKSAYIERLRSTVVERNGRILPGVTALLDALSGERDTGLGLATGNFREAARVKLDHFGLWERFVNGGFGDHTTDRAEVVAHALDGVARAVGTVPDAARTVVIGDTPRDIEAAKAAGARVLAVATGFYTVDELRQHEPDVVMEDLSDTPSVLDFLLN